MEDIKLRIVPPVVFFRIKCYELYELSSLNNQVIYLFIFTKVPKKLPPHNLLISLWLGCSLTSSSLSQKGDPACNWHKIPSEAQCILFHLNPCYDTSALLNVCVAGASCLISLAYKHCAAESPSILWLTDSSSTMAGALPPVGISPASYSQSWLAASRGWKPILNNRAFIFNELLRNNIWARDLCRNRNFFQPLALPFIC